MGGFHFGKNVKYRASEEHWITPKHYAHCTVHVARRIWDTVEGDRLAWMGAPSEWVTIDGYDDKNGVAPRDVRITRALYDSQRAVTAAVDVMNRYAKQERMHRRIGGQIRLIHHRYRWVDAKPPGFFPAEVREAFYAILDAKETRAAYSYMRQFNVDAVERAELIAALDALRH